MLGIVGGLLLGDGGNIDLWWGDTDEKSGDCDSIESPFSGMMKAWGGVPLCRGEIGDKLVGDPGPGDAKTLSDFPGERGDRYLGGTER